MRLAARGARNLDGGEEPVADEGARRALRALARRIFAQATLAAALLTLVALAAPL